MIVFPCVACVWLSMRGLLWACGAARRRAAGATQRGPTCERARTRFSNQRQSSDRLGDRGRRLSIKARHESLGHRGRPPCPGTKFWGLDKIRRCVKSIDHAFGGAVVNDGETGGRAGGRGSSISRPLSCSRHSAYVGGRAKRFCFRASRLLVSPAFFSSSPLVERLNHTFFLFEPSVAFSSPAPGGAWHRGPPNPPRSKKNNRRRHPAW